MYFVDLSESTLSDGLYNLVILVFLAFLLVAEFLLPHSIFLYKGDDVSR